MNDEEVIWDFECMVPAKELATFVVRGKLQEVRRVCEDADRDVSATVVEVIELAGESIKMKRDNAALIDQSTGVETKHVQNCCSRQ